MSSLLSHLVSLNLIAVEKKSFSLKIHHMETKTFLSSEDNTYPRNKMYEVEESLNVVMFFTRQTYPNKHDSSRVFPSPNDLQHCLTFSLVFIWLYSQNVKSQIEYNYTEHGTFLMFRVLITFASCTSSQPFLCHVVRFVRVCSNLFFITQNCQIYQPFSPKLISPLLMYSL